MDLDIFSRLFLMFRMKTMQCGALRWPGPAAAELFGPAGPPRKAIGHNSRQEESLKDMMKEQLDMGWEVYMTDFLWILGKCCYLSHIVPLKCLSIECFKAFVPVSKYLPLCLRSRLCRGQIRRLRASW